VFDPFAGSGTAAAVCRDLGIPCQALDVRYG
jgi:DNA modification methylase